MRKLQAINVTVALCNMTKVTTRLDIFFMRELLEVCVSGKEKAKSKRPYSRAHNDYSHHYPFPNFTG